MFRLFSCSASIWRCCMTEFLASFSSTRLKIVVFITEPLSLLCGLTLKIVCVLMAGALLAGVLERELVFESGRMVGVHVISG